MSRRNSLAELVFLFRTGLSRLISKLSLISRIYLWCSYAKMVNSSKYGILLQFRRWSRITLSLDGLTFLNVKMISQYVLQTYFSSVYASHRNRKNYTFHTYIYKQLETLSQKVSDLWVGKHQRVSFEFWKQFEAWNNLKCFWNISIT